MPALDAVLDLLAATYGEPEAPPRRSVLDLVWLENVAYLVDDKKRAHAFNALRTHVGTRPEDVLNASEEQLQAIASAGILPANQAAKLKRIAALATELDGVELLPVNEAKRRLMKFPSIGEPGAEKILMLARTHAVLGPRCEACPLTDRCRYYARTVG